MTNNSEEESKIADQLFDKGISKRADELIEKAGANISREQRIKLMKTYIELFN